jgi:hypothetical protein
MQDWTDLLTQTAKIGVGATTQLVELLQDPQNLSGNVTKLQDQFNEGTLTTTLEEKGSATVTQAQELLQGVTGASPAPEVDPIDAFPIQELEELTQVIKAMREQLRQG